VGKDIQGGDLSLGHSLNEGHDTRHGRTKGKRGRPRSRGYRLPGRLGESHKKKRSQRKEKIEEITKVGEDTRPSWGAKWAGFNGGQ